MLSAIGRNRYRGPVCAQTYRDEVAFDFPLHVKKIIDDQLVYQLCHTLTSFALGDEVGKPEDGRRGIRHGYGALATRQKGMIIFCIANAYSLVERKSQLLQCISQPGSFVDAGGEHHYGVLIKDNEQLQSGFLDGLQYRALMRQPRRHHYLPDLDGIHAKASEACKKLCGWRFAKQRYLFRTRRINDCAVFRHNIVKQV